MRNYVIDKCNLKRFLACVLILTIISSIVGLTALAQSADNLDSKTKATNETAETDANKIPAEFFRVEGVDEVQQLAEPLTVGEFQNTAPDYTGYSFVNAYVENLDGNVTAATLTEEDGVKRVIISVADENGKTANQPLPDGAVIVLCYTADGIGVAIGKNVTSVAPFMPPVVGKMNKLKMMAAPSATDQSSDGIEVNKTSTPDETTRKTTITLEAYATGEKVITNVPPTDIILVLDVSSSMSNHRFGYKYNQVRNTNSVLCGESNVYYILDNGNYYLIKSITKSGGIEGDKTIYTYTYVDSNGITKTQTSTGKTKRPNFVYQRVEDDSAISRLEALTNSAKGFVDIVHEKSSNICDNRVAVVTFSSEAKVVTEFKSMKDDNNVEEVKKAINNLPTEGDTDPQTGLNKAKEIFDANPIPAGQTRNRVVVFFTDGTPGTIDGRWNSDSTTRADSAVKVSEELKGSGYGATVYAIGIFNGTDASSAGIKYTDSTNTSNAYEVGEHGNYFMQLLSSNNGTPQSPGYYLSANDDSALNNIFTEISEQIEEGGSYRTLTEETVVRDIVTPYFTIPQNAEDIQLWTEEYIAENSWKRSEKKPDDVKVNIKDNELTVTGFNFSENWVGKVQTDSGDQYRGKKLVISFTVSQDKYLLGGSNIPTNDEKSGIYENAEFTELLKKFNVPTVPISLKTIQPEDAEWNVYLTAENPLRDLIKQPKLTVKGVGEVEFDELFDGKNNEFVDVSFTVKDSEGKEVGVFTIPAGKTEGSWTNNQIPSIISDTNYTIECKVTDHNGKLESTEAKANIKIHVYSPTLDDIEAYYGDKVTLWDNADQIADKIVWKNSDGKTPPATMDNEKPYCDVKSVADNTKINRYGYVIVPDKVITVDAVINVGESNPLPVEVNYNIHVKTVKLVVVKSVEGSFADKSAGFNFSVKITPTEKQEGLNEPERTFSLPDYDNQKFEEELTNLPKGAEFEIKEIGVPKDYEVYFVVDGKEELKSDRTITGNLKADETTVKVINKLDTIVPTGIDVRTPLLGFSIILFVAIGFIALRIYVKRKTNKYSDNG